MLAELYWNGFRRGIALSRRAMGMPREEAVLARRLAVGAQKWTCRSESGVLAGFVNGSGVQAGSGLWATGVRPVAR
jgi:hypothetical protein